MASHRDEPATTQEGEGGSAPASRSVVAVAWRRPSTCLPRSTQSEDLMGLEILDKWSLWTLLEERAVLEGKLMLAVLDEEAAADDCISYSALYDRSARLAAGLTRRGIGQGAVVCSMGRNSTDGAALLFACAGI